MSPARPARPWWPLLAVAPVLAACAGTPPPATEMSSAELAVREAEEADARTYAPMLLQQWRVKLARARQAVSDESMLDGRRLAEQAVVDAQLAEAQARAEVAQRNLEEVDQSVEQLRQRTTPTPPATTTGG